MKFLSGPKNKIAFAALLIGAAQNSPAENLVDPQALWNRVEPLVSASTLGAEARFAVTPPQNPKPVLVRSEEENWDPPYDDEKPLIPSALWETLGAPDPAVLKWLSSRIPGIDASQIRVMPFSAIDEAAGKAAAQKKNAIDLLTDQGLTSAHLFYLDQETLRKLFLKYDLQTVTPESGTSLVFKMALEKEGPPFVLQAMLAGNGRVELLYSLLNFTFRNPEYPDYPFIFRDRVTFEINGAGSMNVSGISIRANPLVHVYLQKLATIGNGYIEVDTNWAQRFQPPQPITLKANPKTP